MEGWSPGQGSWGPELANMWRTGNDIWPRWEKCILHNLYSNNIAADYQRPGAFNECATTPIRNTDSTLPR